MSRGEELRNKFREKGRKQAEEMNSPFGVFRSKLFSFVMTHCGAMSCDEFARKMYDKFIASGLPDADKWMIDNVPCLFRSVLKPPIWINEPDWAYEDGAPLVFIHQFSDEEETAFYVFRGSKVEEGGYKNFFKMTAQSKGGMIRLFGRIDG